MLEVQKNDYRKKKRERKDEFWVETRFTNETRGHIVSNGTQNSQPNEHYVVFFFQISINVVHSVQILFSNY